MRTGVLAVAVVVALALAVPTVAMTQGGEDDVDGKVTIAPADGHNGEYATVEDGELRVDFDRLNDEAITTAHNVVNLTSTMNETVEVWVAADADESVTVYEGDDTEATLSENRTRTMEPGESILVGFEVDTYREVPDSATLTVGIQDPNETDDGSGGDDGGTGDDGTDGAGDGPDSGFGAPGEDPDADAGDGAVGVEVFFDGEADPDAGEVQVTELDELPEDGPDGEPEAVVERGSTLTDGDDGILTTRETRLVTERGEGVTLAGSRSYIRTSEAIDRQRRAAAIVDITPPGELHDRPGTVRIRVDRERFPETDPTGARIARLTPEGWQLLPTSVVEADDESVLIEARTYGFSVFTVFAENQVEYEWTLPDGTTVSGERLRTSFEEPGVRNVTLTVTDAAGRSDDATKQVIVNDEPSVGIEGASNAAAGEATTLRANVTDEVGNATVTWTLPDGTEMTGRTVTGEFDAGDRVRVTVEDEFGATGRAETTISAGGLARPAAALRATGPPIPVLVTVVLALLATGLVGLLARSRFPEATGDGIYALLRELRSWVVDDSPRVTVVGTPTWNPESGCIEIEELRVEAPAGRLDTVEVTVTDGAGTQIVRKEIEVDSGSSYVATPERVHAYGEITLSDDATYEVRVRATDELDRVGTVDRAQSSPLAKPQ
ncbi:hypothetical protein BRD07_08315 [Halobacteriales archaeon QS_9_68_42]|nr:MAG: hypothetical protein BRD07_08315 [Halobacteriales archaeon QS_9_68_42]